MKTIEMNERMHGAIKRTARKNGMTMKGLAYALFSKWLKSQGVSVPENAYEVQRKSRNQVQKKQQEAVR